MNYESSSLNNPVAGRQARAAGIGDTKVASLSATDYAHILGKLEAAATSHEERRCLFALLLADGGTHSGLLDYCKLLLERMSATTGFTGYEAGANLALQYLLAKAPNVEYWVRVFDQSRHAVLRLVVAEHVFGMDPQRALLMMIETLPLAGTDHPVSDAVDLWLYNEADEHFRSVVDSRLDGLARSQPDSALTAAYRHARDVLGS